ncbi:MAG: glycosyltransferase [Usitatibacteraceae bacterium]
MSDTPGLPQTSLPTLSVSIVVYFPDTAWLTATYESLVAALVHARRVGAVGRAKVCLVDNGATGSTSPSGAELEKLCLAFDWVEASTIAGQGNIGYGRANNLAIAHCHDAEFHLVLNPDVKLDDDALANALNYFRLHPECAMISPVATAPHGEELYLAKRFPDLLTLALRGFAPRSLQNIFRARLDHYEHRDSRFDAGLNDVQIASGCFMLVRMDALLRTEGFDPAFFLYFEDFDLSYRISKFAAIARVPDVRIVHAGGSAAAKGWRHRWLFIQSALRFLWKHR